MKISGESKKKFVLCASHRYHKVNHHVVLWLSSSVKCLKCCLILFAICLVLRGGLCVRSWDATPKAMSYSGLGGERRMPRSETWWRVGVWERVGKKKPSKGSFCPVCVCVYVCECIFMCTHMWSRVHLCVGRRNPSSRFLSWASSCVPPAHNSQSRRRRVWPRHVPTHQRRRRRGASVSLPPSLSLSLSPPSSVCFHRSLNVTINPAHTHTRSQIFPHLSIQCVSVYLIWLGRSEPCICACQCGNVCVKSFGSFLNAALPKDPLGNVVLTPPLFSPLVSFLSPFHNYIASVSPFSAPSFF